MSNTIIDTPLLAEQDGDLEAAFRELEASQGYASRDAIVRAGVLLLLEKHREFVAFLEKGFEGPSRPADEVFDEVDAMIAKRAGLNRRGGLARPARYHSLPERMERGGRGHDVA